MKKEYYLSAANTLIGMAEAKKKNKQNKKEQERQRLFLWIVDKIAKDILSTKLKTTEEEYIYIAELRNYFAANESNLECRGEIYKEYFVKGQIFRNIIKEVGNLFNNIVGFKAEYFETIQYGDIVLKVSLNIKECEGDK
ncbi:MAG: hypothetical protein E7311_04275 [Clostridiales bacterium]|nr:hypothetical protein [Clostridiales bacterium]